jgi:hypothetical protein
VNDIAVDDDRRQRRAAPDHGAIVLRPGFETSGWAYSGGQL